MNNTVQQKFQKASFQMYLIVGIIFAMAGVLQLMLPNPVAPVAGTLMLLGAALWIYSYYYHRKHGYLEFSPGSLTIHEPGFKGSQTYTKADIQSIEEKKKFFLLQFQDGKERKIVLQSIAKDRQDEFRQAIAAITP